MKRLLPMTVVLRHIIKNFTGEFKQPSRKDSLKDFLVCNPTKVSNTVIIFYITTV